MAARRDFIRDLIEYRTMSFGNTSLTAQSWNLPSAVLRSAMSVNQSRCGASAVISCRRNADQTPCLCFIRPSLNSPPPVSLEMPTSKSGRRHSHKNPEAHSTKNLNTCSMVGNTRKPTATSRGSFPSKGDSSGVMVDSLAQSPPRRCANAPPEVTIH
jgi:hypothetical protein